MKLKLGGRSGVVLTASATLAVAISACVTTFSAADATLLRRLPYADGERLVLISDRLTKLNLPDMPVAWAHYDEYRNQPALFDGSAGFYPAEVAMSAATGAERVPALRITADFLPLLGVQPLLGRNFNSGELTPGRDRVVLVSHATWMQRFGGEKSVLGQTVRIDGQPHLIAGVLPKTFAFRANAGPAPSVYLPVVFEPLNVIRPPRLRALARLRSGVDARQADESMRQFAAVLAPRHQLYDGVKGAGVGYTIGVTPLRERLYGGVRQATLLFAGAVTLVLLIACANVAGLLLVDWQRRSRDIAVRQALGASRWQLAGHVLRDAFVISAVAACAGSVLAFWLARLLVHVGPPELQDVQVNGRALAFALGVALCTTVTAGLVPAVRAWRGNVADSLRGGRTAGPTRSRRRTLEILVAAEVALAFVLLTGSVLLLRSFGAMHSVDLGFKAEGMVTAQVSLPSDKYRDPQQCAGFYTRLLEAMQQNSELREATMASALPLMFGAGGTPVTILGRGFDPKAVPPQIAHNLMTEAGFLHAFGIRLLSGRGIRDTDTAAAPRVAVINQTMSRRYWPGDDPIGKQIVMGGPRPNAPWMTIVGVVSDVRTSGPTNPVVPQVYSPFVQNQFPVRSMIIAARGKRTALARTVAAIDPDVPLHDARTMSERLALSTSRPRFQTTVFSIFAVVALLLAAAGISAVAAHTTAQRTREAGVRIALGATRVQVLAMMIRDGMRPVGIGLVSGIVIAILCSDVVSGMLFRTTPLDSASYLAAALLFAAVAAMSCAAAARGVLRLDPMASLRVE